MTKKLRVLVCPLDWGLGHATRCIPIVRALLQLNHDVLIASDGAPLRLLKLEFPQLEFVELPGYNISYSNKSMAIKMFLSVPRILSRIKKEHRELDRIIEKHHIDLVISDNRFGLCSNKVPTVFVTHQINIQVPVLSGLVNFINRKYINAFDECWIPDMEGGDGLSGSLCDPEGLKNKVRYLGSLSRFSKNTSGAPVEYDILAIISGPEPQRSIFEELIQNQLENSEKRVLLVSGTIDETKEIINEKVKKVPHLESNKMQEAIEQSEIVLSRAGYSTIMDLVSLGKKAILVPTHGQTEQEYLAEYHMKKGNFYCASQNNFDLDEALKGVEKTNGPHGFLDNTAVLAVIDLSIQELFPD